MISVNDIKAAINAANSAGYIVNLNDLTLTEWGAGVNTHNPTSLPNGMSAIYIFKYNDEYLKVGQAGTNSNSRYQSHHYNASSSNSNLAKSISNDPLFNVILAGQDIGTWIKANTTRYNILIPSNYSCHFVNFVEAFFILKCNPRFER